VYTVVVGPDGPGGSPRGVAGISDPHSISVAADGKKLAFARFPVRQNVLAIPLSRSGPISLRDAISEATPITRGNQVIEAFNLSPDGEWIAFDNNVRGEADIYKQKLAGGEPQLVADISNNAYEPIWSPDGSELAFHGGDGDVWVVSADGGTAVPVAALPDREIWPAWSPDGLSIAFSSVRFGYESTPPRGLWTVSRDSIGMRWREPVQVTDLDCYYHDWLPGGRGVFCMGRDEWLVVSTKGEILDRIPKPPEIAEGRHPRFSQDGSSINFEATLTDGSREVWSIPAQGGSGTVLATFDDPNLTVWTAFVGAESLYITCSDYESDIWVAELDW
jgi:Tol biopolymer transport system component